MMTPLTKWQKIIAYSSLAFVLMWTIWGIFAIWIILTS